MIELPRDDVLGRYTGLRVLVAGGAGFVGRWVARLLSEAGADVRCAVRDPHPAASVLRAWEVEGQTHQVDLAVPGAAEELVRAVRPHVVFNLAGYGVDRGEREPSAARRINADLVAELARAAAEACEPWGGAALVHVGSALEYGEIGGDLDEGSVPHPTTLYGTTKLAGTRALQAAATERDLACLCARLFTVYGPGEHAGRLLPSLLEAAGGAGPLELSEGRQRRDFTHVEDVAEGLLRLGLGRDARGEAVNLATGVLTSVRRFVEIAAQELGIAPERLLFGALPTRAEEMAHDPVSIARLLRWTGWAPRTDVRAGVARTRAFAAPEPDPGPGHRL